MFLMRHLKVLTLAISLTSCFIFIRITHAQLQDACKFDSNSDKKITISDTYNAAFIIQDNFQSFRSAFSAWGLLCNSEIRTAKVLDLPLIPNAHCFWLNHYDQNPECAPFFKTECYGNPPICSKNVAACPPYYNPVYDSKGKFYPSACWAEVLGVTSFTYGYSDSMRQFVQDLWQLPSGNSALGANRYTVHAPNIEFSYSGSGLVGWKNGTFFRSTLWESANKYINLDFDVSTNLGQYLPRRSDYYLSHTVTGRTVPLLLAFVMFDEAYPPEVLRDWTNVYAEKLNDYLRQKQQVPNPVQYLITPVVINPPIGVSRHSTANLYYSSAELQKIYDAATSVTGSQSYEVFSVSGVVINGFGGYY